MTAAAPCVMRYVQRVGVIALSTEYDHFTMRDLGTSNRPVVNEIVVGNRNSHPSCLLERGVVHLADVNHFDTVGVRRLHRGGYTVVNVNESVRDGRQRSVTPRFLKRIKRCPFVGEGIVELDSVGELVLLVADLTTCHDHAFVTKKRNWSVETTNFHRSQF